MNDVQVLLAVKDGRRFLPKLLCSLAEQESVSIHLLVGYAHSNDGSLQILEKYSESFASINIIRTGTGSAAGDFFAILQHASGELPIAYCDQDDIWMPGKLFQSLEILKNTQEPTLVVSNWIAIDERDNTLFENFDLPQIVDLHSLLFQNIFLGSTMMFNETAVILLNKITPHHAMMHDWWSILILSTCGDIKVINEPLLRYRLHDSNSVGIPRPLSMGWLRNRLRKDWLRKRIIQLEELVEIYGGDMADEQRSVVNEVIVNLRGKLPKRIHAVFSHYRFRRSLVDEFLVRIAFLKGI